MEILRKFIQRVQAMKSPDHNGEDNFARDFMVSPSPCCCLVSPASEPTAASPARPGRQRFVCGGKETGGGARANPKGPGGFGGWEVRSPLVLLSSRPAITAPSTRVWTRRERPLAKPALSAAARDHLLFLGLGAGGE